MFYKKKITGQTKNGDIMSRLFISEKVAIILIIISVLALIVTNISKKDNAMTAFNEQEYNTYIVDFKDEYITTRNLEESFKNEIEAIYPAFSDKYNSIFNIFSLNFLMIILKNDWYYIDKTINFDKNLEILESKYKSIFQNNALSKENINIDLYGIKIGKIRVFTNSISKYRDYSIEKMNFA